MPFGALAACAAAAVGAAAAGCTREDSASPPPASNGDSGSTLGSDAAGPPSDAGAPPRDGAAPVDSAVADAGPHGKLIFVHAAPGFGAFRLCFGVNGKVGHGLLPMPNAATGAQPYAGIFPGTAGPLPDITDLSVLKIDPYVIDARAVRSDVVDSGTPIMCDQLIGTDGAGAGADPSTKLALGTQYWKAGSIPLGTITSGHTFVVSILGCVEGIGTGPEQCGAGYDGGTNLSMGLAELDTTSTPDGGPGGGIGAQFQRLSSAIQGTAAGGHDPATNGVVPGFVVGVDGGADGGAATRFVPIQAAPIPFGGDQAHPATAATMTGVDVSDPTATFAVVLPPLDGGAPDTTSPYPTGDVFALPLSLVQLLTTGAPQAGYFAPGTSYTFMLLGDPAKPPLLVPSPDGGAGLVENPSYDGTGLHVIAFPNDVPVKPYQ